MNNLYTLCTIEKFAQFLPVAVVSQLTLAQFFSNVCVFVFAHAIEIRVSLLCLTSALSPEK